MTPNARAKILPSLLLVVAATSAGVVPQLVGLPPSPGLFYFAATFSVLLATALAGARDEDAARRVFHGGAPAYWVPATVWTACVLAAAAGPVIQPHPPGMRWVFVTAGALHALVDMGCRVKNR